MVDPTGTVPGSLTGRAAPALEPWGRRAVRTAWWNLRQTYRVIRANPLSLAGFFLIVLIGVVALLVVVAPGLMLPYNPNTTCTGGCTTIPFAHPPTWQHLLGTDVGGRDVYSRTLAALPIDLGIGVAVAGFSLLFGGFLGLVAGYWDTPGTLSGALSLFIMRTTDVFLSFPSLILALVVTSILGRGTIQSITAVMLAWWPYYTRLVRGEVLTIKVQPYVTAARAAGVTNGTILGRHILRNLLEPIIVFFTMDIGTVIVTYSTISFIGVGVPETVPEWGNMLEQYGTYLLTYPWLVWSVAAAIFVTVLAFSLVGDGLRDLLDPRSRRVLAGATLAGLGPAPLATAAAEA
jgi:peptide/nickel transport system permease protein